MKRFLVFVAVFSFAVFAGAVSRPWTPDDEMILGIPTASGVQISVDKLAPGHLRLTFQNPDVKFEQVTLNKGEWTRITIEGETRRWEVGKPCVPVISRPVLLPNKGNVQLKIVSSEFTEYHNMDVLPQQPFPKDGSDGLEAESYAYDESAYMTDAWYPSSVAELNDPEIVRDARFSLLGIQPVQVNPVTHTVRVYSSIEVETVPVGGVGTNELMDTQQHPVPGFRQFYEDILGADELAETNANAMPGLMLMISRPDTQVTHTLQPYIDWRNRSGRPTTLVTTTSTTPSVLQTFINNAYTANNPPLEMVMLVGDGGSASTAYMLPSNPTTIGGYSTYSDQVYALIPATDNIADIFVGRWPCSDVQSLQLMVNRSLNFERSPAMSDTTWYRKGWGYAETGHPFNRDAVWYCLTAMNGRGIPQTGLYYDEHSGSANSTTINTRCNPGLLFVAHRPSLIGQINGSFVGSVTSNVNKCFVSVHVTCGSGEWYQGTSPMGVQKQLVLNGNPSAPAGAIASMATETGGTHSAPNCCVLTGAYYGLGSKLGMHPAEMFFEGKFQINRNYRGSEDQFMFWNNPMGDIGVNLWTGVPRRITASIPQQIGLGQNRLEFTVTRQTDNVPMAGVLVTALKTNSGGTTTETYCRTTTDGNGHVVLPLTNSTGGNLYVTVIGNQAGLNILPLIDTVSVVQLPTDLGISGYTILDDNTNGRIGNNNGLANPGETVDLNIKLWNRGSTTTATGISATLVSTDPRVVVTNPTHTYSNIAAGDSAFGNGMYRLQLLAGLRNNDAIALRLDVTTSDTNQNRTLAVVVPIHSIQLAFVSATLTPSILNAGGNADISITVNNGGTYAPGTTNANLFSLSSYLSVSTANATFPSLPIGQNISSPVGQHFHVTANIVTIPGTVVTVGVAFNANAVQDTVYFTIPIGTRGYRDPSGPDPYGYLAYDNFDTGYVMHPAYSWVVNDSANYRLNINDTGDGQDASVLVRLPFRAMYYGAQYDTITVCSNGWYSFGAARLIDSTGTSPTTRESHLIKNGRVWRMPSNEGPRNMVAVGWQDLYTTGVYAKNDTTNGWYTITWLGTWRGSGANSYQVLIYDPVRWPTPSGDCMMKFQYKNFSTGTATNEIGGVTIGIQDSNCVRCLAYCSGTGTNTIIAPGDSALPTGTNISRAILFTTSQRFITGNLTGTVRRASDSAVVRNATLFALNGRNSAVTDSLGHYTISDIQIGHYTIRASGLGFNTKLDTVSILEDQTSTLNFYLTAPSLRITLHPQDTSLAPNDSVTARLYDTGQDTVLPIYIQNTGNGPLTWDSQLLYSGNFDDIDSLWDPVASFNVSQTVSDNQLSGVEFDGRHFWVTGSNNNTLPHHLYKLDQNGVLLHTYDCPDQVSVYGWRDLAWDGQYLYGSYSNYIDKIDTNGVVVQRYSTNVNPARAIAVDTTAGVLYYGDQASPIYKMRLSTGASLGSLPNPSGGGLYGLAWYLNDTEGNDLYAFMRDSTGHSTGARIYKINPVSGAATPAARIGLPTESAGGFAITPRWNPMLWTTISILQSPSSCRIVLNELAFNTVWIRRSLLLDTLQANGADTVRVTLSSRFMPDNRYRVAIRFNSNSVTQTVTIPVVMTVVPVEAAPDAVNTIPKAFALEQNYPNPFNPTTQINFALPKPEVVKLTVHNMLGQEVLRLISNQWFAAGRHTIQFDGSKWATGVYFYRIEAGNFVSTKKMVMMK